jgi:hypothetical protein
LQSFTLNTIVAGDFEFVYLKWILNNLNHIQKIKLHLEIAYRSGMKKTLYSSAIDANFIHRHFMPDITINLIHFDFYISTIFKLPMDDIGKIIHSFQIHPCFIDHQWTNVKCFVDPISSFQQLSSYIMRKPKFFHSLS